MLADAGAWHGEAHSVIGATALALIVGVLLPRLAPLIRRYVKRWAPNRLGLFVGALAGAWSHLLLDAFCHADMPLLWPFSSAAITPGGHMGEMEVLCLAFLGLADLIFATRELLAAAP